MYLLTSIQPLLLFSPIINKLQKYSVYYYQLNIYWILISKTWFTNKELSEFTFYVVRSFLHIRILVLVLEFFNDRVLQFSAETSAFSLRLRELLLDGARGKKSCEYRCFARSIKWILGILSGKYCSPIGITLILT